jgi:hypothetical protein
MTFAKESSRRTMLVKTTSLTSLGDSSRSLSTKPSLQKKPSLRSKLHLLGLGETSIALSTTTSPTSVSTVMKSQSVPSALRSTRTLSSIVKNGNVVISSVSGQQNEFFDYETLSSSFTSFSSLDTSTGAKSSSRVNRRRNSFVIRPRHEGNKSYNSSQLANLFFFGGGLATEIRNNNNNNDDSIGNITATTNSSVFENSDSSICDTTNLK